MEMEAFLLCSIHPRQHRKAINVEKMSCNVKGMINQHKIRDITSGYISSAKKLKVQ
jgi:hypothetical protein